MTIEQELLELIRNANGTWITRRELARTLNTPGWMLSVPYVQSLKTLAFVGMIEARRKARRREWEYRIQDELPPR